MHTNFAITLSSIYELLSLIREQALLAGLNEASISHLEVSLEEVFVNVINHSGLDSQSRLEVLCEMIKGPQVGLKVTVCDHGIAFNPLTNIKGLSDPLKPIEDRKIGGLGIFMITQLMDDVAYYRDGSKNVLTLTKMNAEIL